MLSWENFFCLTLNNKVTNLSLAENQQSGKTKEVLTSDYDFKTGIVSFVKYYLKCTVLRNLFSKAAQFATESMWSSIRDFSEQLKQGLQFWGCENYNPS